MKETNFILQQNTQENLSSDSLSDKLGLLNEKRKVLLKEIFERYDRDMMIRYAQVLNAFRGDEERMALYFNSIPEQ